MAAPFVPVPPFPQIGERPGTFSWWSLRQEFVLTPTRVQSALKLALSGTLVLVLAFVFNWPAAFGVDVALFFTRSDARYDLPQALAGAFATWAAGAFYYWSLGFSQNLGLFILVLGGGLTLSGAVATLPWAGAAINLGIVTSGAVLSDYFFQPDPRSPLFLPITSELLLGFLVTFAVQFVLWPYSPRQQWDESFLRLWNDCRQVCARWFAGETAPSRPDALDHQTKEVVVLSSQRIHPTGPDDEGVTVRAAATRHLQEVMMLLHDLRRLGNGQPTPGGSLAWRQLGEEFDRRFAALGDLLAGKERGPVDAPPRQTWVSPLPDGQVTPEDGLRRENLRWLQAALGDCPEIFRALSSLRYTEGLTGRDQRFRWVPAFRWQDLRQLGGAGPWRSGVKVAFLALCSLLFWQAFRWPNGSTVLASALIVNLPDAGSSARKVILRICGLLLGLFCALLCTLLVVSHVETIFGYALAVFLVLAGCGFVTGASSRINYIGFQAAVTFSLTFLGDDRQSVSLEALRGRFVGLVAGVAIAETIRHGGRPVRRAKEMFQGLADNFALCARFWSELFRVDPAEFPARQEEFVTHYNRGFIANIALNDSIEFEGGTGSVRYGYAGRLLVHEHALHEQIQLLGADWARLARPGEPLPGEFDAVRRRFVTLALRLGHPVDLPPFPTESSNPEPEGLKTAGRQAHRWRVLQQRLQQVETILASMDRLTA